MLAQLHDRLAEAEPGPAATVDQLRTWQARLAEVQARVRALEATVEAAPPAAPQSPAPTVDARSVCVEVGRVDPDQLGERWVCLDHAAW